MKTPFLQPSLWAPNRVVLAVAMAMILVVLAPFASALEIHHALAAADDDGHEHSASDLCQWVQHHTGSSVLSGIPFVAVSLAWSSIERLTATILLSVRLIAQGTRAPPTLS